MIMIFLAAVLCSFFFPKFVPIFIVSSIELLNGLILDSFSFVRFSLSHQGSRRRIASLIFYFVSFLQVKLLTSASQMYIAFFLLQPLLFFFFWLSLRWPYLPFFFFLPIMLLLILLLLGMELYLYTIFRGGDVFTAALSNQAVAHLNQYLLTLVTKAKPEMHTNLI